jgi:hypothetical protein
MKRLIVHMVSGQKFNISRENCKEDSLLQLYEKVHDAQFAIVTELLGSPARYINWRNVEYMELVE